MTVRWTSLDVSMVKPWSDLINILAVADETEEFYEPDDLVEDLAEEAITPELDTVGVWDGDRLVGYGYVRVQGGLYQGQVMTYLGGGVHPEYRGQGIGRQLMDRMEARTMELAARRHPGVEVMLRASGNLEGASVRPMLEHRGYVQTRFFHDMRLPLPATLDLAGLPAVQPFTNELSEQTRLAHNEAFAEHWASTGRDETNWSEFIGSRAMRPALSFIAVAEDGQVDAYTITREYVAGEAYVDLVGVRPRARHRGLARACLGSAVNAASAAGFSKIELGVDTENAQGAGGLYASMGFEVIRLSCAYTKVLPAQ